MKTTTSKFEIGDLVVHADFLCSRFEIEGVTTSGKYYLKLPGRMDKNRHAKILQPVDVKLLRKTETRAL